MPAVPANEANVAGNSAFDCYVSPAVWKTTGNLRDALKTYSVHAAQKKAGANIGFVPIIVHMRAFEVYLNGKRLCLAGVGNDGVLTTNVTHVPFRRRRETRLYVGGLVLPQDEHVFWRQTTLRLGDEIRLKIVEKTAVDRPRKRSRRDPAAEAKVEKRQLRKLATKFGWKLQKSDKSG